MSVRADLSGWRASLLFVRPIDGYHDGTTQNNFFVYFSITTITTPSQYEPSDDI